MARMKVALCVNSAWNIVNFRSGLVQALLAAGCEVVAMAPHDTYADRIEALGARFVHVPIDAKGKNPLRDAHLLAAFLKTLRRERPDVFLGFTVKPNIYGSIASRMLGIQTINNIAGLGHLSGNRSALTRLVHALYKFSLSRSSQIFFQNNEDMSLFKTLRIVEGVSIERIPGSGVNLERFRYFEPPAHSKDDNLRFILVARLLWEKGVREFVEAARIVKAQHPTSEFCLLGFVDSNDPAAVPLDQVNAWVSEGVISYLGTSDRVEEQIRLSDCVVLPSYYGEGVPRALLEAAATGRPIVTTNAAGCRDIVTDGLNGFHCRARDGADLAEQMKKLIAIGADGRLEMGRRGREKAEREFDEKIVIQKYLKALSLDQRAALPQTDQDDIHVPLSS